MNAGNTDSEQHGQLAVQEHHPSMPTVFTEYDVHRPHVEIRSDEEPGVNDLVSTIWRRKWVVIATTLAGLAVGAGVSFLIPPVYRARTSLQVEGFDSDHFLSAVSVVSPEVPNASAENYLQNEVKLLESDTLASRVAGEIGMPAKPEPDRVDLAMSAIRARLSFLPEPAPTVANPDEAGIRAVKKALNVRTSLQSQVVDVLYDDSDPHRAAAGANAVATQFMEMNREARSQMVQDTTEWLSNQAAELKLKLEQSNQQLEQYVQRSGLVLAGKQTTLAEDSLRQIHEAVARAATDRAAKQAAFEVAVKSPDSVSDSLNNSPLRQYQADLGNLQRELSQLQTVYTAKDPKIQGVEAQIASTEEAIRKEHDQIVERLRNDYIAAAHLEQMLVAREAEQSKLAEQGGEQERQYEVLKSENDTTQKLYESMLEKLKEAGAASALRATNIRVIDSASAPSAPYTPNLPLNSAIGFGIGALGGIGILLLGESSPKIRRPGESRVLDIQELGVIPAARDAWTLDSPGRGRISFLPPTGEPGLVTWNQDTSLLSESYRSAVTSILFSAGVFREPGKNAAGRVLVLTSIDPMAGKTSAVSNLGIASAERNLRTLLIDADLRRPRLHSLFNLPNDRGLTDLLKEPNSGDAPNPPLDLVRPTRIPNLFVLTSGPGWAGIESLLSSERLPTLLEALKNEFDVIYIDTPPMMLYSDARIIGRVSHGVVMVVRANTQTKEDLRSACLRLERDRIPLLGSILNDWRMHSSETKVYGKYYNRYRHSHHS